MRSILFAVLGVVVGLVLSYFVLSAMVGVGAGVGIVTGLKAGACLTVEAAREQGLITEAQVPEVLRGAVDLISKEGAAADDMDLSESGLNCQQVVQEMRDAGTE